MNDAPTCDAPAGEGGAFCLTLSQGLCGLLLGFVLSATMAAIAVPSFESAAMSHAMAGGFERLALLGSLLDFPRWLSLGILVSALACSWIMTARALNPGLPPFPFGKAPRPGLAWAAVLVSGAFFLLGVLPSADRGFDVRRSLDPAFLAWAAGWGAVCWLILSPAGWAGDLRAWPWARPEGGPRAGALVRAGALGAGFGFLTGLFLHAGLRTFDFLFQYILEIGSPAFEVNFRQGLLVYSLPLALAAGFFAVCFGAAPAFAADGSGAWQRLRRAAFPAALLAAAGLWLHGLHGRAKAEGHWRAPSLAVAAALPDADPKVWTLVVLGADGQKAPTMRPWPAEAKLSYGPGGTVAATEANARALEAFLAGPGRHSRFRRAAADALPRMRFALWDQDGARGMGDIVSYVFGESIIDTAVELSWLSLSAPVTPANRARLERLTDPARARLRGRAALNAARAWRRFGDLERVRRWLAVTRLTRLPEKRDALPDGLAFADGVVEGRVALDGRPLAGARVGLFRLGDEGGSFSPPSPGYMLGGMADARVLGSDGAFRFERLTEGRYGLCLLAPPGSIPAKAALKAGRLPGVFELSRGAPRADLGLTALSAAR